MERYEKSSFLTSRRLRVLILPLSGLIIWRILIVILRHRRNLLVVRICIQVCSFFLCFFRSRWEFSGKLCTVWTRQLFRWYTHSWRGETWTARNSFVWCNHNRPWVETQTAYQLAWKDYLTVVVNSIPHFLLFPGRVNYFCFNGLICYLTGREISRSLLNLSDENKTKRN